MKKFFFCLAICFLLEITLGGTSSGETAKEIFEQGWKGYRDNKSATFEKEEMWMIIMDGVEETPEKKNLEEVKNLTHKRWGVKMMTRYLKYDAGLLDKVYINFTFPPRDDRTQFLIWRYPDKEDDFFMYSPALTGDRRVKRLPTAAQEEDHFMGSALTYEDIRRLMGETGQTADKLVFSFAKEETVDNRPCYVIEVRPDPVKKPNTGYGLRKFYRDKENSAFVKVDYFDKYGNYLKTQKNSYIYINERGLWRPRLVEMYEIRNKTSTILYFSERKILLEKELPPIIFEINYMMRHGR